MKKAIYNLNLLDDDWRHEAARLNSIHGIKEGLLIL